MEKVYVFPDCVAFIPALGAYTWIFFTREKNNFYLFFYFSFYFPINIQ